VLIAALGAARPAAAGDGDGDDDDVELPTYTCAPAAPTSRLAVTFKPEISVAELAVWVAGFTCENVIIAPDVAKHATRLRVIAPRPLTPREAVKLFTASLEAAGLKVRHKDRTFSVTLGPGMPRACPDVALAAEGDGAPIELAPPLDADRLADKLAAGIRKLDATHVEVSRAIAAEALASPVAFTRGARVLPASKDGAMIGFKLYAVRPGGVLAHLGLANGDTITAVAGQPLDSLDHAMDAYTAVRAASRDVGRVDVAIIRRGVPVTLTVTIVP
jgi:general secretion pathway protein C